MSDEEESDEMDNNGAAQQIKEEQQMDGGVETVLEDEEMDMEILSNLIQSYLNQPTSDGPMQSVMTSMGFNL